MTNRKSCCLKIGLILVYALLLSACSAYQEHFKCKAQPGLGCSSVTEVNGLVNQGWPLHDARKKSAKKESFFSRLFKCKTCKSTNFDSPHSDSYQQFLNHHPNALRIWIAPHKSQNHYWDEQFVYSELNFQENANADGES